MSNLYKKTIEPGRLMEGYKRTQEGNRKYRKPAIIFEMNRERKLEQLREELNNRTYQLGDYSEILVKEPKERVVHAPRLRDKIVQYAAHETIQEQYRSVFINDTYACIKGRGTHDAVYKIQHYIRECVWEHGDAWIVKVDIRKYFYSINREILKELYRKQIPKYERDFLDLLDKMVDNSPEPDGKGIPLGNVTSQDFANITGNEIDQFAKRYLGIKRYVRYMDDMFMVVPTKELAQDALAKTVKFINERLNLEVNAKTTIYNHRQGVKALGYNIKATHITLQRRTIQAMRSRMREIDRQVQEGTKTVKDAQNEVNSWLGHARYASAFNLCKGIFKPYPYITIEGKTKFGEPKRRKNGKRNNSQVRNAKGKRNTVCHA